MAFWVKNNYKTPFVIKWNGSECILNAEDWNLLTDEMIEAYFPTYESLKKFLPKDELSAIKEMRSLIEIYLSRWGPQIDKYYKLTSNVEVDVDNFFKFLNGFEISIEKIKK